MPKLVVSLFGAPRADLDGAPVRVDTRKALALLAYLCVTGRPRSRDELAVLLWPDYDDTRGRRALRRTLSSLKAGLGGRWLAARRDTIWLEEEEDVDLDVVRFHRSLACPKGDHPADGICDVCRPLLAGAVSLASGEFMAGFTLRDAPGFDDWQSFQAEELRRELAGALERLVRGLSRSARLDEAVGYARRWVALDPLHEPAHRALMELYAGSGDRSAAIRQYRDCVRALDEELGVAPLEETNRLYRDIQRGLAVGEPAEAGAAAGGPPPPPALPKEPARLPFVGREAEWAVAEPAMRRGLREGHLLVIEGEAGVGKTRLAEELSAAAARDLAEIVRVRAYAGEEHLPYALVASAFRALAEARPGALEEVPDVWRRQAARIVAEFGHPGARAHREAPPVDVDRARRFLHGLAETLLSLVPASGGCLLVLDDLEWADPATLRAVAYTARRLRGRGLALVAIWRTGGVSSGGTLASAVADGEREGWATVVIPSRLRPEEVGRLVRSAGGEFAPGTARRIHELSEGVPFYVAEYLRDAAAGTWREDESGGSLPPAVEDLLRGRLRPLGEAARQVLDAAAVLVGSADARLLQTTSGRSGDEVAAALGELTRVELLRASAADGSSFDFGHHTVREFVRREIGPVRWRLLNRRAAAAMSSLPRARREALTPVIARHRQAAGEDDEAAELFELAGRNARAVYANRDAAAHLEAALALGHPDRARLHEEIGDARTLLGEYARAVSSYEAAAAGCVGEAGARIERKLGDVLLRWGDFAGADQHFVAALDGLGPADGVERSRVLADRSLVAHRLGRDPEAGRLAGEAAAAARAAGDAEALAQAHNILGILALRAGDHAAARTQLLAGVELGATLPEPTARIAALNNLALAAAAAGDLEEALARAGIALDLCARQGDRHREAAIRNNRADFLHRAGREEDSMDELKRAVAIFAEIGDPLDERRSEIWKLVEW